jgi:hypothetical protein
MMQRNGFMFARIELGTFVKGMRVNDFSEFSCQKLWPGSVSVKLDFSRFLSDQ